MKKTGGVWHVAVVTDDGVRTAKDRNLRDALANATARERG
jgi:hypothetical protein